MTKKAKKPQTAIAKKKGGQINELLRNELAILIKQRIELMDVMITVTYVDCSPDLQHADVNISILPEKFTGTALEKLRKHTAEFAKALVKQTRLRHIPRLRWVVDDTEIKAAVIDELFKDLK